MKLPITAILCLISILCQSQIDSAYYYYKRAKEAKGSDTTAFYTNIMKAHHFHPYHPGMLYEAAVASCMMNKQQEAITFLKKVLLVKADVELNAPEFQSLQQVKDFSLLTDWQTKTLVPIVNSDTAFVINDRTLHLECIAKGAKPHTFFFGSIHKRKIITSDNKGNFSDFATSAADGLTSVFGIKVDAKRKLLWACASPMREMENYDSLAKSAVFKYNVETQALIAKYQVDDDQEHIFGDLTLDPQGNAFVSDSRTNTIYTPDEKTGKLIPFFTSTEFWNLQGIAFDNDGKNLFIADYIKGIYRLERVSKKLTKLEANFDLSIKTVDGLTFYKNSLIAIQNFIYPMRVTQYFLSKDQSKLERYKIIDSKHPAFNEPTIGCLDGNNFYYIANSLWSGYDDNSQLRPDDQLQNVVILKTELQK